MSSKAYCAHVIMYVRFKDGNQNCYPIWENIYLVLADSFDEAEILAKKMGEDASGDSNGTFYWSNREAEWVFGGVRKIISCANSDLVSGIELTYSEYEITTEDQLKKLVAGKEVDVKYVE